MTLAPVPDRGPDLLTRADLEEAFTLLTRLPMPSLRQTRGAYASWAYPVVGLAVGLAAAVTALLTSGLPAELTAGIALATMIVITGAMHEDGLSDSADGLWSGRTPERRLAIMADSRVGAYGVIALVFSIGLRWSALAAIAADGTLWASLVAAAVLSRASMVTLMHMVPNARETGLSSTIGQPTRDTTLVAVAIAAAIGFATLGLTLIPVAIVLGATTLAVAAISRARIGGQSGDILGATQQIGEVTILIVLAY